MPDLTLGFDTSAAHCAAAVVSGRGAGAEVLAHRCEPMQTGQAERLFPLLAEVLAEAGVSLSDLTVLGVGTGPGNFTGIRIAVAAARGLSLSLGIPAVGVSVTEAAALDLPRPCRVAVPARRGELIWQDFGPAGTAAPAQSPADALPPGPVAQPAVWPVAVAVARIAAERAAAGDQPRPAPVYLRPADAAPPRDPAPAILP